MQDLYERLVDWFRKRKYKFHEKIYKHKHPSPFGVERQYIWAADREVEDYLQTHYEIYFHTYDAHDIEVIQPDGSKKIFTKGRIWVELRNWLNLDWEERWNASSFYAHLKSFYNKYVFRKRFEQGWAPRMRYELYDLHALIKRILKMENDQYEFMYGGGYHRRIP